MNMAITARGWLVYDMTSSATDLGWVTLSFTVPQVIFSLWGGVLADRLPKRRTIAAGQFLNALASSILAVIILTNRVEFWDFIWFGAFNGSVLALSMPARQAFVPQLVGQDRVINAMALNMASWNLARILGPALAGLLIALLARGDTTSTFGVGVVYLMISALYLLASLTVLGIRMRGNALSLSSSRGVLHDIGEGVRYVRSHRPISALILLSIMPFLFGMPLNTLLPAFNADVLSGGADDLGVLLAAMGLGAIIGSLMLARAGELEARVPWLIGSAVAWGVGICLFSQAVNLFWACLGVASVGWFSAWNMSLNRGLMQILVEDHMRGRIMSIDMMSHGLMPLGIIPVTYIAEIVNVQAALIFSGSVLSAVVVLMVFLPMVRSIREARSPLE